jgi:hypothetical protein
MMAEDAPQQPVEQPQRMVDYQEKSVILGGGSQRGLDSMGVAPPVPASQLPEVAQSQAAADGASAQDTAPMDYDG